MSKTLQDLLAAVPGGYRKKYSQEALQVNSTLTSKTHQSYLTISGDKDFVLNRPTEEPINVGNSILGVLIGGEPKYGCARSYFPDTFSEGRKKAPACSSHDGITPSVAKPIAASCSSCPNSIPGSHPSGYGSACRRYKTIKIYVLTEGVPEGVFNLRISGNSLKNLGQHLEPFVDQGMPVWTAITEIEIADNAYIEVDFKVVELLSDNEQAEIAKIVERQQSTT